MCTQQNEYCTMYIFVLYTAQCTLYTVQCTYSCCTLHNVHYTLYNVHIHVAHCTMYILTCIHRFNKRILSPSNRCRKYWIEISYLRKLANN